MSSKRCFDAGVEIPTKTRFLKRCLKSGTKTCVSCENLIYQHKEFKANLKELKRKPPNEETIKDQSYHMFTNFGITLILGITADNTCINSITFFCFYNFLLHTNFHSNADL